MKMYEYITLLVIYLLELCSSTVRMSPSTLDSRLSTLDATYKL